MAIFKKEYIQKHPVDGQIQIQVPENTTAEIKEIKKNSGYYKVTCDKPVTKDGGNSFNITEETKEEYLSE